MYFIYLFIVFSMRILVFALAITEPYISYYYLQF